MPEHDSWDGGEEQEPPTEDQANNPQYKEEKNRKCVAQPQKG